MACVWVLGVGQHPVSTCAELQGKALHNRLFRGLTPGPLTLPFWIMTRFSGCLKLPEHRYPLPSILVSLEAANPSKAVAALGAAPFPTASVPSVWLSRHIWKVTFYTFITACPQVPRALPGRCQLQACLLRVGTHCCPALMEILGTLTITAAQGGMSYFERHWLPSLKQVPTQCLIQVAWGPPHASHWGSPGGVVWPQVAGGVWGTHPSRLRAGTVPCPPIWPSPMRVPILSMLSGGVEDQVLGELWAVTRRGLGSLVGICKSHWAAQMKGYRPFLSFPWKCSHSSFLPSYASWFRPVFLHPSCVCTSPGKLCRTWPVSRTHSRVRILMDEARHRHLVNFVTQWMLRTTGFRGCFFLVVI